MSDIWYKPGDLESSHLAPFKAPIAKIALSSALWVNSICSPSRLILTVCSPGLVPSLKLSTVILDEGKISFIKFLRSNAVPDGESFFSIWCVSSKIKEFSSENKFFELFNIVLSAAIPVLVLEDNKIGISLLAILIVFSWSSLKPVVPISKGIFLILASSRVWSDDWGEEKSIIKSMSFLPL